jgi:hypothetical protein
MARLEAAKFVEGRYIEKTIGGHKVRERNYKISGSGRVALYENRAFFESDPDFGILQPA